MDEASDSPSEDDLREDEPDRVEGGAMESLEIRVGRAVNPRVDLDASSDSEHETKLGSIESPPTGAPAPSSPDHYETQGEIARGGMGAIYRVRDKDLRRSLAMKVMLGGTGAGESVDPEHLARFLEEAQVTAQLAHPGVVPVHELGVDSTGRVYFTMSLVRGETLAVIIEQARAEKDGWSRTRALQVILRVCETMAFAHDKGVIHRDIKPANIMVGKFGQTYVMDWGIAKVLGRKDAHDIRLRDVASSTMSKIESKRSESAAALDSPIMTMDGAVIGTPAYMPPEQAEGRVEEVDKRSDVYAIGALLYQLLTGAAPYINTGARMSPHAVLAAVSMGPPRPIHELDPAAPEELQAICEKAMARDRDARYASAEELADDLQRFLSGHVVRAHRTGAVIEMKKWVVRNRSVAATAAAAAVLLGVGAVTYTLDVTAARDAASAAAARESERAQEAENARSRADAERTIAEGERDAKARALLDARSVEIAFVSSLATRADPIVGLILARAAVRRSETPAAISQLHVALSGAYEEAKMWGPSGKVRSLAYSPDGSGLVTASGQDIAQVRDVQSGDSISLKGHSEAVTYVRYSPDGARIATGSDDHTARIWDTRGGELAVLEGSQGSIHSVEFSPDGSRVVTASSDRTARIWDLDGNQVGVLNGHGDIVVAASFSPDGSRVVTASADTSARIWDVGRGTTVAILGDHGDAVVAASFSPDGSRVVTASRDGTAYVWSAAGELEATLSGHRADLCSARFSPTGAEIVTASRDRTARVWTVDGDLIAELRGHDADVVSAEFSRDGQRIVTASHDRTARVWSVRGREIAALRGHAGPVVTAVFAPDGTRVATYSRDQSVRIWRTQIPEMPTLCDDDEGLASAEFSPDGRSIVVAKDDSSITLWSAASDARTTDPLAASGTVLPRIGGRPGTLAGRTIEYGARSIADPVGERERLSYAREDHGVVQLGPDGPVNWDGPTPEWRPSARFSPDGEMITTVRHGAQTIRDLDGAALHQSNSAASRPFPTHFSADGSLFLTHGEDDAVSVRDTDGREVAALVGHAKRVFSAKFSPDGSHVVTGSLDRTASIWSIASGERVVLRGHEWGVVSAEFSPDGLRVLTGSIDETARIWDIAGETIAILRGHDAPLSMASYSPDGALVVTAAWDRTARLWTAEGVEIAVLRGHADTVRTARFSPDGSRIVTACDDGTARIWDTSGAELAVLRGHRGAVRTAEFSSDGSLIVTASADGSARVWLVHTEDLMQLADELITRELGPSDRSRYGPLLDEN